MPGQSEGAAKDADDHDPTEDETMMDVDHLSSVERRKGSRTIRSEQITDQNHPDRTKKRRRAAKSGPMADQEDASISENDAVTNDENRAAMESERFFNSDVNKSSAAKKMPVAPKDKPDGELIVIEVL